MFKAQGGITWSAAEANAEGLGGHLVSVHSGAESSFLQSLVSSGSAGETTYGYYRGPWIGGALTSGSWGWSDGSPFNYRNWFPGQPDNYDGVENHLQLYGYPVASTWNDAQGDWIYPTPQQVPMPDSYIVEWGTYSPSLSAPVGEGGVTWNSGKKHNGNSYEVFTLQGGVTWSQAEANAEALGGHLASVHSDEESDFIQTLVANGSAGEYTDGYYRGPWIGGVLQGSLWTWSDGSAFNYTNWYPGQPDNDQGVENHIQLYGDDVSSTWNDAQGDWDYPDPQPISGPDSYIVEWSRTGYKSSSQTFVGISAGDGSYMTLTLGAHGNFTGTLIDANGKRDALHGKVNSSGFFSGTAGSLPYSLQITGSTKNTYVLTGTAGGSEITGYAAAYSPGQKAAERGTYTLLFSSTDIDESIPQGASYATLTILGNGAGIISGKLADGTGFTTTSLVVAGSYGHQFIMSDHHLYQGTGLLAGNLRFSGGNAHTLDGLLQWEKSSGHGPYYPAGFTTTLEAVGAPFGAMVTGSLPFTSGTLSIIGAGNQISEPFVVRRNGTIELASPNTASVRLNINILTGAVTGSFDPDGVTQVRLNGLLIDDGTNSTAAGFFLMPAVDGTGLSGGFTLP